ncbi:MAG: hypothetical protein QXQ64_06225 [Candidatus Bathyarchaeia archaeon]
MSVETPSKQPKFAVWHPAEMPYYTDDFEEAIAVGLKWIKKHSGDKRKMNKVTIERRDLKRMRVVCEINGKWLELKPEEEEEDIFSWF